MDTKEQKTLPTVDQFPVPQTDTIKIARVESVCMPHPYCITSRHVAYAADHCGGMLGKNAIREAEKHGASCQTCRDNVGKRYSGQTSVLSYDEHESMVALFLRVPKGDLNGIPGLKEYLVALKPVADELGIGGIAFIQE